MIIAVHVVIALSSIISSSWLLLKQAKIRFIINYILIGLTLISGTYLVISTHSALLPSCEAGLAYLVVVSLLTTVSYRRFSNQLVVFKSQSKN